MSSKGKGVFTKENLDTMLKELAKEFKKRNGTVVPADSVSFIHDALERGNYETIYAAVMEEEKNSKDMLVEFGKKYPGVTTQSNAALQKYSAQWVVLSSGEPVFRE